MIRKKLVVGAALKKPVPEKAQRPDITANVVYSLIKSAETSDKNSTMLGHAMQKLSEQLLLIDQNKKPIIGLKVIRDKDQNMKELRFIFEGEAS